MNLHNRTIAFGNEFIMYILHSIQLLFFSSTDASNSQFLSSRINHSTFLSFHLLSVSVTVIPTADNLVKMIILQNASNSDCFCHCQQWFHLHHLLVFASNFWLVSRSTIFSDWIIIFSVRINSFLLFYFLSINYTCNWFNCKWYSSNVNLIYLFYFNFEFYSIFRFLFLKMLKYFFSFFIFSLFQNSQKII